MVHDCDVYVLVPLRMLCGIILLKDGFQFLVRSLHQAYGLCVFCGCVFNANAGSSLFRRLFHNFGSARCAFVSQYDVWDTLVYGKMDFKPCTTKGESDHPIEIANMYFDETSIEVRICVKRLDNGDWSMSIDFQNVFCSIARVVDLLQWHP